MKLLLASQSPRRRQMLAELGYPIEFISLDVEESMPDGMAANEVAGYLSRLKAAAYPAERIESDQVLVTADTVVVHQGNVLGKPHDREEALQMLRALAGDRHGVYTGVCLRTRTRETSFIECTHVQFAPLGEEELAYYVDTYRPFDKAGAYGIQEWIGMVGITAIEGCYYNVVGLPVARLYSELKKLSEICPL